jgi:hypothetical protein
VAALAVSLSLLAVLSGCGPRKVTVEPAPALDKHQVRSVVVVPFQRLTTPQALGPEGQMFNVPRGAKRSDISLDVAPRLTEPPAQLTVTVPASAPEKVTDIMFWKLSDHGGVRVLSPDDARRVLKDVGDAAREWTPERIGREVASRLNVDAALVGKVLIYRERIGSKWGADSAAVGFEVQLVAADGALLWTANYYEKQRPLNEDVIGGFEHGGVFVTADELIAYGAEKIAKIFPYGAGAR